VWPVHKLNEQHTETLNICGLRVSSSLESILMVLVMRRS